MPENEIVKATQQTEWFVQIIPFCFAIALSCFGGVVSYLHRVDKNGLTFSFFRLALEVFTSGFVGIVSFMLCDSAGLSWPTTAAIVAISGHMGTRALFIVERAGEKMMFGFLKRSGYYDYSETKAKATEEEDN